MDDLWSTANQNIGAPPIKNACQFSVRCWREHGGGKKSISKSRLNKDSSFTLGHVCECFREEFEINSWNNWREAASHVSGKRDGLNNVLCIIPVE